MAIHSFKINIYLLTQVTMKSISVLLAIGLIAFAQAQEACDAVVAEIPSCAVRGRVR